MFHERNAGASQMSFQPRNVASASRWWRAIRAGRSVVRVRVACRRDAGDRAVLDEHVGGEQHQRA